MLRSIDIADQLVLAMATARISAAISAHVSYTSEFRSRCSSKEAFGRSCRLSAVRGPAFAF